MQTDADSVNYKQDSPTLEMDYFVRNADSLVPVEVKANDGPTASLKKLIMGDKYKDIKFGIKFGYKNIGFNGEFYTFPYFLAFLLKRFLGITPSQSKSAGDDFP